MIRPVFVSHGAPTLLLEDIPARHFLAGLAAVTGRPAAVVAVSAHWETAAPCVGAPPRFATIHDFYGFPPELCRMTYSPPGDLALADELRGRLAGAGLPAGFDGERGLDHGAWVPLKAAWPAADIPVVSLSIQPALGPRHHFAMGQALAGLDERDILVLASGSATHNLGALDWGAKDASPWAAAFDRWLADRLAAGDVDSLLAYREAAPHGVRAHPRDEHLLPLFVALGAAGARLQARRIHESFTHGSLSMAAFGW